jgi:hypothetical protein
MDRLVIALTGALLIFLANGALARGGHGGGGGGHGGGGHGGGYSGAAHAGGGFASGFSVRAGSFGAVHSPAVYGFRPMAGSWQGARVGRNRHVVIHKHRHRRVFVGGYDSYSCYPLWNGYAWVSSCDYDY